MNDPAPADANLTQEQRYSSALQQLIGYKLVDWEPDRAVIAYEVAKDHLNRTNCLHGGIIATLDTAGGYCGVYCDTPGETRATVTLSRPAPSAMSRRRRSASNQALPDSRTRNRRAAPHMDHAGCVSEPLRPARRS